jgi:hypothetical protein
MALPEGMIITGLLLHAIADEIDRRAKLIQQDDRSASLAAAGLVSSVLRSTANEMPNEERPSDQG